MNASSQPVLIYDGECAFCQRAVQWVQARDTGGAIEYLPCQDPSRPERFPHISTEQCLESMQFIAVTGETHSAERAFPHLLAYLPGWRWMGKLFRIPGVQALARPAYALIARNRYAISGLIRHKDPATGEACGLENRCD